MECIQVELWLLGYIESRVLERTKNIENENKNNNNEPNSLWIQYFLVEWGGICMVWPYVMKFVPKQKCVRTL